MSSYNRPAELTLSTPLRALSQFPSDTNRINLNAEEWNILAMALQHANAELIIARTGYSEDHVLHMIGHLMGRGLLTSLDSPATSEPQAASSMPEQMPTRTATNRLNLAILRRLELPDQRV